MVTKRQCYKRRIWKYDEGNYNLYRETLSNCDWSLDTDDVDDNVETIVNNMLTSANSSVPNKSVLICPRDLPWFHNQIRQDIRKRNQLHKIAKQTYTPEAWARLRESRNKITTNIRNSKINYFKKIANNLQHRNLTNKNWWKLTKQFLKVGNESDIPILIKNDEQFSSPVENQKYSINISVTRAN